MTVSQPDRDGQSSSLALLIWLMMTMMVMMPMIPLQLLCSGRASPLASPLPLLDGNTDRGTNQKIRRMQGRRMRRGGVWGRRGAPEWRFGERRAEKRERGGVEKKVQHTGQTWRGLEYVCLLVIHLS